MAAAPFVHSNSQRGPECDQPAGRAVPRGAAGQPGSSGAPQEVPVGLDPSQAMRLQREMLHIWQPALEHCGVVWCKTKPNARKLTRPH